MLQGIVRAIRYGTRLLARSPLVTATAILSLSGYRRETLQASPSANVLLVAPATVWGKETTREPGGTENGSGFDRVSCLLYADLRNRVQLFENVPAHRLEPAARSTLL